jgi:hypothetical protein
LHPTSSFVPWRNSGSGFAANDHPVAPLPHRFHLGLSHTHAAPGCQVNNPFASRLKFYKVIKEQKVLTILRHLMFNDLKLTKSKITSY